jgi:LSD1 subclass zinc finger protein
MQLQTLTCPNCGATVNVPPGATSVKCDYCGSTFAITLPQTTQTFQPTRTPIQRALVGCPTGCVIWLIAAVLFTTCMDLFGISTDSTGSRPNPVEGLVVLTALLLALLGAYLAAFPERRASLIAWFRARRATSGRR